MTPDLDNNPHIGVLGGGQLGRMLIREAMDIGIPIHVLDPNPQAPCRSVASSFSQGDLQDPSTVFEFGKDKDIVTIEIEHVSQEALSALRDHGVIVRPSPETLGLIQDKGAQKRFYKENRIPTAPFQLVDGPTDMAQLSDKRPFVQKLRVGGYDGKGVQVLSEADPLEQAFDAPSVIEEKVDIEKELAVIIARNPSGESAVFPLVELVFDPRANLVDHLFSPADLAPKTEAEARSIGEKVAHAYDLNGIMAVEMFLTKTGELLVNEAAPRPHNSGHHTIEANLSSQYGQHLRGIMDLPLAATDPLCPAVMVNLLGASNQKGPVRYRGMKDIMRIGGARIHLYGKKETRPFRKMGHITVLDKDLDKARKKAERVKELVAVEGSRDHLENTNESQ